MLFFNLSSYSQNELLNIGYLGHCSGKWTAILVPLAKLVLLCVGIIVESVVSRNCRCT